jgi:hypothetical protein
MKAIFFFTMAYCNILIKNLDVLKKKLSFMLVNVPLDFASSVFFHIICRRSDDCYQDDASFPLHFRILVISFGSVQPSEDPRLPSHPIS